jgi:hypothetical protein
MRKRRFAATSSSRWTQASRWNPNSQVEPKLFPPRGDLRGELTLRVILPGKLRRLSSRAAPECAARPRTRCPSGVIQYR